MKKWMVSLFVMNITTIGISQDDLDWVIKPIYKDISSFSEGLALVSTERSSYYFIMRLTG